MNKIHSYLVGAILVALAAVGFSTVIGDLIGSGTDADRNHLANGDSAERPNVVDEWQVEMRPPSEIDSSLVNAKNLRDSLPTVQPAQHTVGVNGIGLAASLLGDADESEVKLVQVTSEFLVDGENYVLAWNMNPRQDVRAASNTITLKFENLKEGHVIALDGTPEELEQSGDSVSVTLSAGTRHILTPKLTHADHAEITLKPIVVYTPFTSDDEIEAPASLNVVLNGYDQNAVATPADSTAEARTPIYGKTVHLRGESNSPKRASRSPTGTSSPAGGGSEPR